MWVPSHVGIKENEMADEAASLACQNVHDIITIDKISSNDIFTSIRHKTIKSWQLTWDSIPPTNKLRHIKKFNYTMVYSLEPQPTSKYCHHSYRIGHTFLTHSFLISKDQPPICSTCQTRITKRHISEECPIYEPTRTLLNQVPTPKKSLMKNLPKKSSSSSPKTILLIKYKSSSYTIINLL
jgi:hypothetical protein